MKPAVRVAVLSLLLGACQPSAQAVPGGVAPPAEPRAAQQVLRIAVKGLISNPTPQASSSSHHLFWPLYDNLTMLNDGFRVSPSIAQKWELAPSGTAWRFSLRTDATFSNGDPLTAEDVAFSINTILKESWPQRALLGSVTEARALDAATVEIVSRQLDVTIPSAASFIWILPKRHYETVGSAGFVVKPIGSGPYELADFKGNDTIRYVKRAAQHPFRKLELDELTFRVIPENSQIINGLKGGEIDVAALVTWTGEQMEQLKSSGMQINAEMSAFLSGSYSEGVYATQKTPLADRRVREALNYAIDRPGLINALYKGWAEPAAQLAVKGSAYFLPEAKPYPYDPARAKALLSEAGYPNGFRLTNGLEYALGQMPTDVPVALQGYLRAVGVEIEIVGTETALFIDKAFGRGSQTKGDIVLGRSGDVNGFGPSRTFLGCGKPAGAPAIAVTYCNPAWDSLLDAVYTEPDPTKRQTLLQQANRLQLADFPSLLLWSEPYVVVSGPKVRGIRLASPFYFAYDTFFRIS